MGLREKGSRRMRARSLDEDPEAAEAQEVGGELGYGVEEVSEPGTGEEIEGTLRPSICDLRL